MVKDTRSARFAFVVTLFLVTNLLTGTYSAHALTPVLSTTSNISNGALDPTILLSSTNFATDLNKFDFTVDVGATGLTFDSASFVNSTRVRVNLRGTAQAGSISIQANISVFNPVADSPSNTLIVKVPDPLIAQTITFDAFTPMMVNESDQILSASSTSGLDVSFSSKTPNTCRIVSQKIHALVAGTCSIKASQNGNSTYQAASDIIKSLTISPLVSAVSNNSNATPVATVAAITTFATFEYFPDAPNNKYRDLVLSSSGDSQLGATKLKLLVPSGATQGRAAFLVSSHSSDSENAQGFFVARIGLVNEFGVVLNRLEKAYEINMPKGYLYSEIYWSDLGTQWQRIPETMKKSLPTDSHAAFFREIDGSVSVLTDQLGLFGYRFPQNPLEINSPAPKLIVGSQVQLSSAGGSGTGDLAFGTTTSAVCEVTPIGVVTGKKVGACFVTARKNASEQYIDALSNKIVITVQSSTPVASNVLGTNPVAPSKGVVTVGQTTCNLLSYSLTSLDGQVQANFCPQDAGKVAILYVRSASSTRKWVDKKVASVVIGSNGVAVFDATLEVRTSNYLHVFVNGEHKL